MSVSVRDFGSTICAIATPPGIGSIAVVRVSGADAFPVCTKLFEGKITLTDAPSHTLHYGRWRNENGIIDTVVVSVFRAPHSYTGEDVVEISCHGGYFMAEMVLSSVLNAGIRLADPGEFTRRAFLNRRLDLTQVEAVADIIHSQSKMGVQTAARQLEGGFTRRVAQLRKGLLDVIGLLELELDFSEEDVEFVDRSNLRGMLSEIVDEVDLLASSAHGAEVLRSGFHVAVVGFPNAGKSSLFNALLGKDRAIVSNVPGTTRDYVSEGLLLDGYSILLHDTAGLRDTADSVEIQGIALTKSVLERSDCVLVVNDATLGFEHSDSLVADVQRAVSSVPIIIVHNKADCISAVLSSPENGELLCSALDGTGIRDVRNAVLGCAKSMYDNNLDVLVNARQATLLSQISSCLRSAIAGVESASSPDLLALDIRAAIRILGDITGESWNPDLLDTVFSRFCIGK